MSHKVSVKVALNTEGEIGLITEMEKELDSCAGIYKVQLKDQINKVRKALELAKKEIKAIGQNTVEDDRKLLFQYQQRIDTVMKAMANISSAIDYGSVYKAIEEKSNNKINDLIAENGVMAMFAVSEINEAHEELSYETLLSKINEIRNEKLNKEERAKVISKLENTIIKIDIPNESKEVLILQSDELSSPQEFMDLIAMLKSHELSFKRMKEDAILFEKALVSKGFSLTGRTNTVSAKGELELNIKAFKEGTKDISVTLNSSMSAEWQHGDYEHHMCKADADAFLEELEKVGIKYSNPLVLRTHSNSKPLLKAAKLKERGA